MKQEKVIPMIYDRVFKTVLQRKESRGYLSMIISEITGLDEDVVYNNMVFKNTELMITQKNEKVKITDLIVEIKDNVINLEMNKNMYNGLFNKNHAYISKIREGLVLQGQNYSNMKSVIQINFDNFNAYNDDRIVIKFEMLDEKKGIKEGVDVISYHVILPNVKKI